MGSPHNYPYINFSSNETLKSQHERSYFPLDQYVQPTSLDDAPPTQVQVEFLNLGNELVTYGHYFQKKLWVRALERYVKNEYDCKSLE